MEGGIHLSGEQVGQGAGCAPDTRLRRASVRANGLTHDPPGREPGRRTPTSSKRKSSSLTGLTSLGLLISPGRPGRGFHPRRRTDALVVAIGWATSRRAVASRARGPRDGRASAKPPTSPSLPTRGARSLRRCIEAATGPRPAARRRRLRQRYGREPLPRPPRDRGDRLVDLQDQEPGSRRDVLVHRGLVHPRRRRLRPRLATTSSKRPGPSRRPRPHPDPSSRGGWPGFRPRPSGAAARPPPDVSTLAQSPSPASRGGRAPQAVVLPRGGGRLGSATRPNQGRAPSGRDTPFSVMHPPTVSGQRAWLQTPRPPPGAWARPRAPVARLRSPPQARARDRGARAAERPEFAFGRAVRHGVGSGPPASLSAARVSRLVP